MSEIAVVIVDDDALVRTGLGMILGADPEIRVVAEAGDGDEAVAVVVEHTPDVVLMDIRMPRRDGLSATREILAGSQPPRVLVLTTFDTDEFVLQALRAGAAGFLLKDTPPARMIAAVRAVAAGDPVLSPSVTRQVIAAATASPVMDRQRRAAAELAQLNERERAIARLIGEGRSNAEIASELFLSVATVKAHVTHIFDKLGCDNRVQVAMRVHDAGES